MPPFAWIRRARCLPLLVAAVLAPGAWAAPSDPSTGDDAPAQDWTQRLFGDHTQVTVGVSAVDTPRYDGARQDIWEVLPVLSVQRGIVFVDSTRGAGLQFQSASGLYVSQSLYYDFGRVDHDSTWRPGARSLAGLGQVADAYTTRSLVADQFTPWFMASAEAEFALRDGARRQRYRAGIELTPWETVRDELDVDLDGHWGDRRYNQAYFGVDAGQAQGSGLARFDASGGLYAGSLGMEWDHKLGAHWASVVQLTGTRYLDKAAGSPIVQDRWSAETTLALTYTY